MKDYNINKVSSYLEYWDVNNLNGWAMSRKLPTDWFITVEDLSEFNEDFIKSYIEKSNKRYLLEVRIQNPENLREPHTNLPFLPKINKTDEVKKLVANLRHIKKIPYTNKKSKTSIKPRFSFEKISQSL